MRLTELSLEKYGGCASRELAIPETAGLTVVYGANEAGKSTCLEAISDFLFSIPKNTQRGSLFGYDGMRIGATMLMACLLYTSPSPRDGLLSRMPSSA